MWVTENENKHWKSYEYDKIMLTASEKLVEQP